MFQWFNLSIITAQGGKMEHLWYSFLPFFFALFYISANLVNNIFFYSTPSAETWRCFYCRRPTSGRCFPLWFCKAENDEVGSGWCEDNTAEGSRWRQSAIKILLCCNLVSIPGASLTICCRQLLNALWNKIAACPSSRRQMEGWNWSIFLG